LAFAVDRRQALAVGGGDGDLDLRALAAQLGEDSGAEFVEPALLDGGGEDDVAFEAAARVLPELGLLLVREAVDLVEYQDGRLVGDAEVGEDLVDDLHMLFPT